MGDVKMLVVAFAAQMGTIGLGSCYGRGIQDELVSTGSRQKLVRGQVHVGGKPVKIQASHRRWFSIPVPGYRGLRHSHDGDREQNPRDGRIRIHAEKFASECGYASWWQFKAVVSVPAKINKVYCAEEWLDYSKIFESSGRLKKTQVQEATSLGAALELDNLDKI
eukprot:gene10845-3278_t